MKEAWLQFGFILVEQYTTSCKKIAASAGVGYQQAEAANIQGDRFFWETCIKFCRV